MKLNEEWKNWEWQQRNSIYSIEGLLEYFPNLDNNIVKNIKISHDVLKFKITPYLLSLIKKDNIGNPISNDPIWQQVIPNSDLFEDISKTEIKNFDVNWELPEEMINPILHHKYYNRVVLRIQNNCLSYCMYCFESKRTLDPTTKIPQFNRDYLNGALEYISNNNQIEEVIISGGEPLLMSNQNLEYIFSEIRKIKNVRIIRFHTRAFTHNPYRFEKGLFELIKKYNITSINVHFSHPNEITEDLKNILDLFNENKVKPIILAHIPLLKGINDDPNILLNLFMLLYENKIIPYYLLHAMPDTLGTNVFRTKVKKGVEILRELKRKYSNPALPEYIIVHKSSKHTVPFELEGTSEFEYHDGYIRFKNYKGDWCIYKEK